MYIFKKNFMFYIFIYTINDMHITYKYMYICSINMLHVCVIIYIINIHSTYEECICKSTQLQISCFLLCYQFYYVFMFLLCHVFHDF